MSSGGWDLGQRALLEQCYAEAIHLVDPVRVTHAAICRDHSGGPTPCILAIGKAAHPMLDGALQALAEQAQHPAEVLVISDTPGSPSGGVTSLVGDHPVPGDGSHHAANALGAWIQALPVGQPVMVLLSGGASSLIADPIEGIPLPDFREAFGQLHAIGLDIATMNAARRQFSRWSGGRLRVALGQRPVVCYLISDVLDDDIAVVGSGPLIGGPLVPVAFQRAVLNETTLQRFPASVQRALSGPPPAAARSTIHHVVTSSRTLMDGLTAALRGAGHRVHRSHTPLTGTTTDGAAAVATAVIAAMADPTWDLLTWGGELTVTLGHVHGTGGRCQQFAVELALRLAIAADAMPSLRSVMVLAAGTDGRDGPTDAAGAFATSDLPALLRGAGFDPQHLVERRDTHTALARVGALHRPGRTGTNVADLVLVSRRPSVPRSGPGHR